jgi:hypothetical protein
MRPDSITLALFEKYTPEEMTTTAQQMAQAQADLESVEVEKKVSDAAFNERIKKLAADVSELAKKYNKGGETAQIGCDIHYDHPEVGKKSYFRMDRNELVETHDMSWEEKQETIQFPLAENAPEPSVSDISAASLEKLAEEPAPSGESREEFERDRFGTAGPVEEVTQLCPFPGCTLFIDHDGDHDLIPKPQAAEEPKKPKRKLRGQDAILPDARKPTDLPPAVQP